MRIKTKKANHYPGDTTLMLQLKGHTLMCITPKQEKSGRYYESDLLGAVYNTIAEAKQHLDKMLLNGHFGQKMLNLFLNN